MPPKKAVGKKNAAGYKMPAPLSAGTVLNALDKMQQKHEKMSVCDHSIRPAQADSVLLSFKHRKIEHFTIMCF